MCQLIDLDRVRAAPPMLRPPPEYGDAAARQSGSDRCGSPFPPFGRVAAAGPAVRLAPVVPLRWTQSARARRAFDILVNGEAAVCTPEGAARAVTDLERAAARGDSLTMRRVVGQILGWTDSPHVDGWLELLGYPASDFTVEYAICASYPACQNLIGPRQACLADPAQGRVWCAECAFLDQCDDDDDDDLGDEDGDGGQHAS